MDIPTKKRGRFGFSVWIIAMTFWIAAAWALWSAMLFAMLWIHVYMQRNHGWRPLAESFVWLSDNLMWGIFGMGIAVATTVVIRLGNRGALPGTSR